MKETKERSGLGKGLLIGGAAALAVGLVTKKLMKKHEQIEELDFEDIEEIYDFDEEETYDEEEE